MILGLYRVTAIVGEPVIRLLLARRRQRGKEDSNRFGERVGIPSIARPGGPLAWIHAASVGEAISVLSLINRLRRDRPGLSLLVTTGTVTSAAIMEERLPDGVLHQYVPVDHPRWVARFLTHWKPDLALWVESEFWPNTLSALSDWNIPVVLINARVSPVSFARWKRFPSTISELLSKFSACFAQSGEDEQKLISLGARDVRVPGNLKFAADPLPAAEIEIETFKNMIANRLIWAAISTHPGEEEIISAAHNALIKEFPTLLTVIVPRHPVRGEEISNALKAAGHFVARRALSDTVEKNTGIYVIDTVGELGLVYRMAQVAFIGGSLVPHGGQNLLEAAKLDCAIVHGPWMTNFASIVQEMRQASAIEEIADCQQLVSAVTALLKNVELRQSRIQAASQVATQKDRILDDVLDHLAPFLDPLTPLQKTTADAVSCHAQP